MDLFNSILLGALQGITEFLPISSSGHLVIAEDLLNIDNSYMFLFNIFVHLGTLCAIIYYYRNDIKQLCKGIYQKEKESINYILFIILATIPAFL